MKKIRELPERAKRLIVRDYSEEQTAARVKREYRACITMCIIMVSIILGAIIYSCFNPVNPSEVESVEIGEFTLRYAISNSEDKYFYFQDGTIEPIHVSEEKGYKIIEEICKEGKIVNLPQGYSFEGAERNCAAKLRLRSGDRVYSLSEKTYLSILNEFHLLSEGRI